MANISLKIPKGYSNLRIEYKLTAPWQKQTIVYEAKLKNIKKKQVNFWDMLLVWARCENKFYFNVWVTVIIAFASYSSSSFTIQVQAQYI